MPTTPDFVAQNSANLTAIRYYTDQDPYFYTVDNRPLTDLATNLVDVRTNGADSARRAGLVDQLMLSSAARGLAPIPTGYTYSAVGLVVTNPSTNTITVNPGSVFYMDSISVSLTTSIQKQAMLIAPVSFTTASPSVGQSIVYTIEGTITDLSSANMVSTAIPYLDTNNPYLPSTLINKELVLSLNTGTAATTGSETVPATSSGKFPLYNVTVMNTGSTVIRVWAHTNSPYFGSPNRSANIDIPSSSGATFAMLNDTASWLFTDAATTAISLRIPILSLNPYNNLRFKLVFVPTVATGNAAFRIRYKGFTGNTDLITAAQTNTATEAIAVGSTANQVQTFTTVTSVVPNSEFAGFSGNTWGINRDRLTVLIERQGASGTDTTTANINLLEAILVQ